MNHRLHEQPIYIADAAIYLKAHQPDLGIDHAELTQTQFERRGRAAQPAVPVGQAVLRTADGAADRRKRESGWW
ncbi:MAG: hypothetical protein U0838_07140 [Chloroflexota bacterium]